VTANVGLIVALEDLAVKYDRLHGLIFMCNEGMSMITAAQLMGIARLVAQDRHVSVLEPIVHSSSFRLC